MPPPSLLKGRAKVAEFYSASCGTIPPLPWQSFPPPFSPPADPGKRRIEHSVGDQSRSEAGIAAEMDRISDDISGPDRRQPPLDRLLAQRSLPARRKPRKSAISISLTLPRSGGNRSTVQQAGRSCRIS